MGWAKEQVIVIDEDLGLSGSGSAKRSGFARMTAEVALGHVGIVLGLEVSRLARNNADWYRLLDLCGITDTLIGDSDGIYHPSLFNDRLILGLKGTMSEAELHVSVRGWMVGSVIRRHVANCVVACPLALSGGTGRRDLFHPMSLSSASFAPSFPNSQSLVRSAKYGCGSAPRDSYSDARYYEKRDSMGCRNLHGRS